MRHFTIVFALVVIGCKVEASSPLPTVSSVATESERESESPLDQCIVRGGHLLGDGFCIQSCTNDDECTASHGVCSGDGICVPATWKGECTSDAACGLGAKCVGSVCRIACEADTECGPLRCVTSCANAHFSEVRFCAGDDGWPANASEPSLCNEP